MKESTNPSPDESVHVFRFKLKDSDAKKAGVDPLVEMVRCFIADFLDLGCFTHKGERVQVDGFYFTNDPGRKYRVYDKHFSENEISAKTFKNEEEIK